MEVPEVGQLFLQRPRREGHAVHEPLLEAGHARQVVVAGGEGRLVRGEVDRVVVEQERDRALEAPGVERVDLRRRPAEARPSKQVRRRVPGPVHAHGGLDEGPIGGFTSRDPKCGSARLRYHRAGLMKHRLLTRRGRPARTREGGVVPDDHHPARGCPLSDPGLGPRQRRPAPGRSRTARSGSSRRPPTASPTSRTGSSSAGRSGRTSSSAPTRWTSRSTATWSGSSRAARARSTAAPAPTPAWTPRPASSPSGSSPARSRPRSTGPRTASSGFPRAAPSCSPSIRTRWRSSTGGRRPPTRTRT